MQLRLWYCCHSRSFASVPCSTWPVWSCKIWFSCVSSSGDADDTIGGGDDGGGGDGGGGAAAAAAGN